MNKLIMACRIKYASHCYLSEYSTHYWIMKEIYNTMSDFRIAILYHLLTYILIKKHQLQISTDFKNLTDEALLLVD